MRHLREVWNDELFSAAAGNQLGSDPRRCGTGADAGGCGGLGRLGGGIVFGGRVFRRGDVRTGQRFMAGSGGGRDDIGGPALRGMVKRSGGAGKTIGDAGRRDGGRVRRGAVGDGASGVGRGQPQSVCLVGAVEHLRAERSGDRGYRGAVRGDVGAGCVGDVRLSRGCLGNRVGADAVCSAAAGAGRPTGVRSRRCSGRCRHTRGDSEQGPHRQPGPGKRRRRQHR